MWSQDLAFDEIKTSNASIVVNELGTNILKHATRGEIICTMDDGSISILAIDKGPGIENIVQALEDGYSTSGTAGNGIGAIRRLSSDFDLFSQVNKGTIVLSRFFKYDYTPRKYQVHGFSIPLKGETVSGDQWICIYDEVPKILVADGLGHGLLAHEAATTAMNAFTEYTHSGPLQDVNQLHGALRSTRGAAVSVSYVDLEKNIVDNCGLGNIAGVVVNGVTSKKIISYAGTAGVQLRKVQSLAYPAEKNSLLIMHSDGLSANWSLNDYPGLIIKHPLIIAGVLYRDYSRGNDDSTVIVGSCQ